MTHHEDENFLVAFNFSLINHGEKKKKKHSGTPALQQQDELGFGSWKWWGAWTVAGKCRKRSGESTEMGWARLAVGQSQALAVVVAMVAMVAAVVAPPRWRIGHLLAMRVVKN